MIYIVLNHEIFIEFSMLITPFLIINFTKVHMLTLQLTYNNYVIVSKDNTSSLIYMSRDGNILIFLRKCGIYIWPHTFYSKISSSTYCYCSLALAPMLIHLLDVKSTCILYFALWEVLGHFRPFKRVYRSFRLPARLRATLKHIPEITSTVT